MTHKFCAIAALLLLTCSFAHTDSHTPTQQMIDAASAGNLTQVQAALKAGAELNGKDVGGSTALHQAALGCHLNVVQFLASQPGIDLNPRDVANETPFTETATSGCLPVVQFFVHTPGTILNAANFRGQTALVSAINI